MSVPRRMHLSAVIGLVLLAPAAAGAEPDRAAIDDIVKPFLKDKPYLGLVVGVTRPTGHQILGYGQVILEGKQRVPDGATIFEIGSITKIFTGTLLADQVLCGAMRLDDPVQKYLPNDLIVPRRDERAISLLHLATHTSSLPVQPPSIGLFALASKDPANPYAEYDEAALRRTLATLKLARPIGSRFEYSNLGAGLLGHALAHAAKTKSYEELLVQRLAKPLALADTRLRLSCVRRRTTCCCSAMPRWGGEKTRAAKRFAWLSNPGAIPAARTSRSAYVGFASREQSAKRICSGTMAARVAIAAFWRCCPTKALASFFSATRRTRWTRWA
jgi:CubicO group peptidase (beta-lactamase class C family)